jgi:hypothetical protein
MPTLIGKRLPADPGAALACIIQRYPHADRERLLRIFEACLEDDHELASTFRREAALRLIDEHRPERPRA